MPYNEEGFYVESAPQCGKDFDRHCANLVRDAELTIDRIDAILSRCASRRNTDRFLSLEAHRNALLIEAHEQGRANACYDARRSEAMEDATGQDEDMFYERNN